MRLKVVFMEFLISQKVDAAVKITLIWSLADMTSNADSIGTFLCPCRRRSSPGVRKPGACETLCDIHFSADG